MQYQFEIVKLRFKTPLHLSKGKVSSYEDSEETLHSDTIKSAIFATLLELYDINDPTTLFDSFRVSSAFPFFGEELFFPKPMLHSKIDLGDEKQRKKVKWLERRCFEQVLNGNALKAPKHCIGFDKVCITNALPEGVKDSRLEQKLYVKEQTQRVKIPKQSEPDDAESTPFYMDKLYFPERGGLFFLMHLNAKGEMKETLLKQLHSALRLLGDNGIGLQRNLGNGQFVPEPATLELNLPDRAAAWVSLSLYCPKWNEWQALDIAQSAYQFVKRGGWISAAEDQFIRYRKRSVHMLSEGSVLPFEPSDDPVLALGKGKIDLKPTTINPPLPTDMEIWRDGTGIFLPITTV